MLNKPFFAPIKIVFMRIFDSFLIIFYAYKKHLRQVHKQYCLNDLN